MNMSTFAGTAAFSFVLAASSTIAQTVVNGPYYATPSWDQTIPTASRFLVLANFNSEAVLDRETGLTWWRNPGRDPSDYFQAQRTCALSRVGGRFGWRLPTTAELMSIFDTTVLSRPYLPVGHPFGPFATSLGTKYWTASPDLVNPGLVGMVGYGDNNLYWQTGARTDNDGWTFCVRGPT